MKPQYVLLLLWALVCSLPSSAQLRLLRSTAQNWVGGIAGMSGENYTFIIACPNSADFHPDTLWIGSEPIKLTIRKNNNEGGNATIKTTGASARLEITAKVTHNERELYPGGGNTIKKQPPIPYKGVALLGYKQHNKQRYFNILRITDHLPSLSFP